MYQICDKHGLESPNKRAQCYRCTYEARIRELEAANKVLREELSGSERDVVALQEERDRLRDAITAHRDKYKGEARRGVGNPALWAALDE